MKVAYLSDIHVDFWLYELNAQYHKMERQLDILVEIISPEPADVMVIAGDLGHYYSQDCTFLTRMRDIYQHVILVTGNHDLYLVSRNIQEKYAFDSTNRVKEMKEFCAQNDGMHYLDGNCVDIGGVTFGGVGGGWDDTYFQRLKKFKPSKAEIIKLFQNTTNDSRLIFADGKHNYPVYKSIYDHPGAVGVFTSFDPVKYFMNEMDKLNRISAADVMVSHYGPATPPDMCAMYAVRPETTFYHFNGDEAIKRIKPKVWIYGHTHDVHEFEHLGTKVLCNPLGYPGDGYSPTKIKYFDI